MSVEIRFSIDIGVQWMCETKIEFKCLYCGMLYDPNEELDCPECEGKSRIAEKVISTQ